MDLFTWLELQGWERLDAEGPVPLDGLECGEVLWNPHNRDLGRVTIVAVDRQNGTITVETDQ